MNSHTYNLYGTFHVLWIFDITNLSKWSSISFLQHFTWTQLRLTALYMTKHSTIQCNFGPSFSPSKDVQQNCWQLHVVWLTFKMTPQTKRHLTFTQNICTWYFINLLCKSMTPLSTNQIICHIIQVPCFISTRTIAMFTKRNIWWYSSNETLSIATDCWITSNTNVCFFIHYTKNFW
jgi:hypothetical protein